MGLGGFTNSSSPSDGGNRLRKRPSDDSGEIIIPPKKIPAVLESIPPPSQSGNKTHSRLQEQNRMLAQLLAKEPAVAAVIPQIPPSIIYATPQEKLPKLTSTRPATGSKLGYV